MATTLDIYTGHFGLEARPFSLVPDPDFLFWSAAHRRAYSMLEYGLVTRAPITLLTGEIGAGKTTLLHHMLRHVEDDIRIGLISNAHGDRGELLRWVLLALGLQATPTDTYVDLFGRFQDFLLTEYAQGRRVVLVFDEAQNLTRESLEELRMFTNINTGKDELLQLVLVGQPELRDMVRRPDLRQFAQRVASAVHLPAMDAAGVRSYIRHRLAVAAGPDPDRQAAAADIFGISACDLIYEVTAGVPRLVNQLADLAMVYAFSKGQRRVLRLTVQQVLDDGVFFAARLPPAGVASGAPPPASGEGV